MKCEHCGSPHWEFDQTRFVAAGNSAPRVCSHCGTLWPTEVKPIARWLKKAIEGKTLDRAPRPAPTSIPSSGKKTLL